MTDTASAVSIGQQASVQLHNLGIDPAELIETLQSQPPSRVAVIDMDGPVRVLTINNVIENIRRIKTTPPESNVPMTAHATARAASRNISDSEIRAALASPRERGGLHTANGVTAVVVSPRGGQRVATVYRAT
jgi:predicted esterase